MHSLVYLAIIVAAINVATFIVLLSGNSFESFFGEPTNDDDNRSIPYDVASVPDVLTPEECDILTAYGESRQLQNSKVWDDSDVNRPPDVQSQHRTSKQTWIKYDDPNVGHIIRKMRNKAAQLTGVYDASAFEELQLAKYESTQEYKAHFDSCTSKCSNKKLCRIATLLVYLNDGFEGGETVFPKKGVKVRPKKGHAVLFYNVNTRDEDFPELEYSLHAGAPVLSSNVPKWIANVWITCPTQK